MEDLQRDHLQWRYQNSAWRRRVQQTNYHAPLPEASEAAEVAREAAEEAVGEAAEAAREAATELGEFQPLELNVYARAHAAEVAHSQQQVDAFSKAQEDLKEKYREENKEALADLRRELQKKFADHREALRNRYREKREEALADLQSELQEKFADEEKQSLQNLETLLRNEHTHASAEAQKELQAQYTQALNEQKANLKERYEKWYQENFAQQSEAHKKALRDQAEKLLQDQTKALEDQEAHLAEQSRIQQAKALQDQTQALKTQESQLAEQFRIQQETALQNQAKNLADDYSRTSNELKTKLEANFNRQIEIALQNQANTFARDHEQALSKQKCELEMQFRNQRVVALNRQAERLFRDQDDPLRKQHQELQLLFYEEQDRAIEDQAEKFAEDEEESLNEPNLQHKYNKELHNKSQQQFRALRQLWSEKDKVIADLSKKLEEVTESLEVAEEAFTGEVAQTDEFLDLIRSRLDEGSQYIGITFPTAQTMDERVFNLALHGKLLASRMYRRSIEQLSRELGLRMEKWPSHEITGREHNEHIHEILDRHVEAVTSQFSGLRLRVEEEQQRTEQVRKGWFAEMQEGLIKGGYTIEALEAQFNANDKLCQNDSGDSQGLFEVGGMIAHMLDVATRQSAIIREQNERITSLSDRLAQSKELNEQFEALVAGLTQVCSRPQS